MICVHGWPIYPKTCVIRAAILARFAGTPAANCAQRRYTGSALSRHFNISQYFPNLSSHWTGGLTAWIRLILVNAQFFFALANNKFLFNVCKSSHRLLVCWHIKTMFTTEVLQQNWMTNILFSRMLTALKYFCDFSINFPKLLLTIFPHCDFSSSVEFPEKVILEIWQRHFTNLEQKLRCFHPDDPKQLCHAVVHGTSSDTRQTKIL